MINYAKNGKVLFEYVVKVGYGTIRMPFMHLGIFPSLTHTTVFTCKK